MPKIALLSLFFALTALLHCGEGSFTIQGEVIQSLGEDETGPVPGAKVRVQYKRGDELVTKSALTGDSGTYEVFAIMDAPEDPDVRVRTPEDAVEVDIEVTKDGYFKTTDTATIQSGDTITKDYALKEKE